MAEAITIQEFLVGLGWNRRSSHRAFREAIEGITKLTRDLTVGLSGPAIGVAGAEQTAASEAANAHENVPFYRFHIAVRHP